MVPLSTRRKMFKKPKHSKLFFCTSFTQERSRVVGNEIGCMLNCGKSPPLLIYALRGVRVTRISYSRRLDKVGEKWKY